jgi:hypothetical protein
MPRCDWPALALSVSLFSVLACSRAAEPPAPQADGGYRLSCTGPLIECLERAEKLCKDEGYSVMGQDTRELLGHEQGQSQVEVRKSEATVYCGKPKSAAERSFVETRQDKLVSASPPPEKAPPLACVPGSTQACIGPGACHGGQACAPDGSRYETCDCSKPSAPAAADVP